MDNPILLFLVVFIAGALFGSALFVINYIASRKALQDHEAEQEQGRFRR